MWRSHTGVWVQEEGTSDSLYVFQKEITWWKWWCKETPLCLCHPSLHLWVSLCFTTVSQSVLAEPVYRSFSRRSNYILGPVYGARQDFPSHSQHSDTEFSNISITCQKMWVSADDCWVPTWPSILGAPLRYDASSLHSTLTSPLCRHEMMFTLKLFWCPRHKGFMRFPLGEDCLDSPPRYSNHLPNPWHWTDC